ncbi:MAG: transposase [Planctomycetia bacterium]|nr:transposase [Planctomycetia bacterium]
MAMGKRKTERQQELWIAATDLPEAPGHPFYRKLNGLLDEHGFDPFVEGLCQKFYHESLGRDSIPPGVYFRMLLIGYFEGIDSERGIAWRCDDSRTLRDFLGYDPKEITPDHSSLSKIRLRIDVETHEEVFTWVLKRLAENGLLTGKTLGIDATTLEANAAMRSIVRRDTGDSYNEFLTQLAQASGIATPTREDLAKIDKKRKNKASNDDWMNPNDPDAKVAQMKDGRTHLAHKAEHAVDLQTGAIVAVTLQGADLGDTTTLWNTMEESVENLREVTDDPRTAPCVEGKIIAEVVADKGYHSNDTCQDMKEAEVRTYFSEPDRGERVWVDDDGNRKSAEQAAVYANRRRIRGKRGKALLRKRGELLERPFAHCYETGGMRRTHLRGHPNILKRLLIHVAGFNLALVMRSMFGIGKPRRLQDGLAAAILDIFDSILGLLKTIRPPWKPLERFRRILTAREPQVALPVAA